MKYQIIICFLLVSFVINDDDVIDDVEVLKNRAWDGALILMMEINMNSKLIKIILVHLGQK